MFGNLKEKKIINVIMPQTTRVTSSSHFFLVISQDEYRIHNKDNESSFRTKYNFYNIIYVYSKLIHTNLYGEKSER